MTTRIPPQNLEAEQSVIGALICDKTRIPEVAAVLKPEYFYKEKHAMIYGEILNLDKKGVSVDIVTLSNHIEAMGMIENIGGPAYLMTCCECSPTPKNALAYAHIVWDKHLLRSGIRAAATLARTIYDEQESREQPELIISAAAKAINDLCGPSPFDGAVTRKQLCKGLVAQIEAVKRGERVLGLDTGFPTLNRLVGGGYGAGWLVVIAGPPKAGKTSLAIKMGNHQVMAGLAVNMTSLEMQEKELFHRSLCQRGHINPQFFRTGNGSVADIASFRRLLEEVYNAEKGWDFQSGGGWTAAQICARTRAFALKTDAGMAIVENLQLVQAERGESKPLSLAAVSSGLKAVAQELRIPVILLSQWEHEGIRWNKQDIDADVDVLLVIERDQDETGEEEFCEVNLILRHNRHGPKGKIPLLFTPRFYDFDERVGENYEPRHRKDIDG